MSDLLLDTNTGGEANSPVPQGHAEPASFSVTNADGAALNVSKGQHAHASSATSTEGEAIAPLPQGLKVSASLSVTDADGAVVHVPQGHTSGASSATSTEGGAMDDVPQGYLGVASLSVPDLSEIIGRIQGLHRERCFWMDERKRSDLTLGAYLRTQLGWSLQKPKAEREAIRAQAAAVIDAGERHVKAWEKAKAAAAKGKVPTNLPVMPLELKPWAHVVVPKIEIRRKTDELEAAATKAMSALAATLPCAEWADEVRGFGMLGLAIIVGEAGDLALYPKKGHLWKRMGVACGEDGTRQGVVDKGITGDARKAAWIEQRYSPVRRSRLYTVGVSLIMAGESPYRQVYLDRKKYEALKAEAAGLIVAPSAKIPASRKAQYRSLGHIDNRARRYVEKRLLRDLWNAWRGAKAKVPQGHVVLAPRHAA